MLSFYFSHDLHTSTVNFMKVEQILVASSIVVVVSSSSSGSSSSSDMMQEVSHET